MLTKEEVTVIDRVLATVEDGLSEIEIHTEYSALQAAAAGGGKITELPSRFRIDSATVSALRGRLTDEGGFEVMPLFDAIAHGDKDHRIWLFNALEAFFKGEDVPSPPPSPVAKAFDFAKPLDGMTEEQVVETVEMFFAAFPGAKDYFVAAKSETEGGK